MKLYSGFHWLRCLCVSLLLFVGVVFQGSAQQGQGKSKALGFVKVEEVFFQGNKAFTQDELRAGLSQTPEFLAAGHPIVGNSGRMSELVVMGYRLVGFPKVKVEVIAAKGGSVPWVFKVAEGPRFVCGKVRVEGVDEKLAKATSEWIFRLTSPNPNIPDWRSGQPAPLTHRSFEMFAKRAQFYLRTNGRRNSVVRALPIYHLNTGQCDLLLKVDKITEGKLEILESFEIEGLNRDTKADVLKFLGIEEGKAIGVNLAEENLMLTGRFHDTRFDWEKGSAPHRWKLKYQVKEFGFAPPLSQPLPTWKQAALDVFMPFGTKDLQNREGELVFEMKIDAAKKGGKLFKQLEIQTARIKMVLGRAGKVMVVRDSKDKLLLGVLTNPGSQRGVVVGGTGQFKWLLPANDNAVGGLSINITQTANEHPAPDGNRLLVMLGAGFRTGADAPFDLHMQISAPAVLVMIDKLMTQAKALPQQPRVEVQLQGGIQTEIIRLPEGVLTRQWNQVSGILVSARFKGEVSGVKVSLGWELRKEAGKKMADTLLRETKDYPNRMQPKSKFASLALVFLDSVEHVLAGAPEDKRPFSLAELSEIKKLMVVVLEPLDEVLPTGYRFTRFPVPDDALRDKGISEETKGIEWDAQKQFRVIDTSKTTRPIGMVQKILLGMPALLFKKDSWAHQLAHQKRLVHSGNSEGAARFYSHLFEQKLMGPIGHLWMAQSLNELNSPLGSTVAKAGLELMNVEGFAKDLAVLAGDDAVVMKMISRISQSSEVFEGGENLLSFTEKSGLFSLREYRIDSKSAAEFLSNRREQLKTSPSDVVRNMLVAQWPLMAGQLGFDLQLEALGSLQLMRINAKAGDVDSMFGMGHSSVTGSKGAPVDYVEAYYWLTKAAFQGQRNAAGMRAQLMKIMKPGQIAKGAERLLDEN